MIFLFILIFILLFGATLFFIATPKGIRKSSRNETATISVVIAARNEATRIRNLLASLRYEEYLEVIVVDDHSVDSTEFIVSQFPVKYLKLEKKFGKKAAIERGLLEAHGEFILQLDADVVLESNHTSALRTYLNDEPDMLILPICLVQDGSLLKEIQGIEQAMLTGISSAIGKPFNANGAHLLYRKESFDVVNGFEGNRHWASGDDSFLLQKFLEKKMTVKHVYDDELTVLVEAVSTWPEFLMQRLRWAGKVRAMWSLGQLIPWLVALLCLYQFFLLTVVSPFLLFSQLGIIVCCFLLLWYVAQLTFYKQVQENLNRNSSVFQVLIASIFFSLYAPSLAILSIFVRPIWKGRKL